jgi:hypothetical protein
VKCSACRRPIATPSLTLAGMVFGPVCARRVLFDAGQVLQPKIERQDTVQRDTLTPDLFQEPQQETECHP